MPVISAIKIGGPIVLCFLLVIITSGLWIPLVVQIVHEKYVRQRIKSILYYKCERCLGSIYEAVKNMSKVEFDEYLKDNLILL